MRFQERLSSIKAITRWHIVPKNHVRLAFSYVKPKVEAIRSGLESLTIRDNIIFGSPAPFDDVRYQAVLDACALRPDLAILKGGDRTGEIMLLVSLTHRITFFGDRNRRERNSSVWGTTSADCSGACDVFASQVYLT